MSVRVFAPAKINLTLQVGRPRADGLHPLQSVVAFAAVDEWIEASPAGELSLRVIGPLAAGAPADDTNLVLRAARALSDAAGINAGAALSLHKDMPTASGIGGGSSDAAAALKALNELWALGLSETHLAEIARTLGSDVPVCVAAHSAFMTGAGESYSAMDVPAFDAVLVNPNTPLPTPAVYRQFDAMDLGGTFSETPPPVWRTRADALAGIAAIGNDLEAPAQALMPELAAMAKALRAYPNVAYAGLSGSGATMFALTDSAGAAAALHARIASEHPNWWARAVRFGAQA